MLHLQVTTANETGLQRQKRNIPRWQALGIEPTLVMTPMPEDTWYFFSDNLRKYLRGSKGCLETHRKSWRIFLETDDELCLISEDDAVPKPGLKSELERFSEVFGLPVRKKANSTDIVMLAQLGWHLFPGNSLKRLLSALSHTVRFRGPICEAYTKGFTYGTHTYLLNRNMAKYLLQTLTSETLPLDVQLKTLSEYYIGTEILFLRPIRGLSHQERRDSGIIQIIKTEKVERISIRNFREVIHSLADSTSRRFYLNTYL
jgi:GR25 family glycosyltransferase involved in LPS biosynthesis